MNRRTFITSTVATATVASTAGCLGFFGDDDDETDSTDSSIQSDDTNEISDRDDDTNTDDSGSPTEKALEVENNVDQISVLDSYLEESSSSVSVGGLIKHTGGDTVRRLRIQARFYNDTGTELAEAEDLKTPNTLNEGNEYGFGIQASVDPEKISNVVLQLR